MRFLGRSFVRAAGLPGALTALGCASVSVGGPDLGGLYSRAARDGDAVCKPVIVIPGILGSKLQDEAAGRIVWGAFGGRSANPERADGAGLVALPLGEGFGLTTSRWPATRLQRQHPLPVAGIAALKAGRPHSVRRRGSDPGRS